MADEKKANEEKPAGEEKLEKADEKEKKWSKESVTINPSDKLTLVAGSAVTLDIVNNGPTKVAFKLKATRPKSIHPDVTVGEILPSKTVTIKIAFKPKPDETPFGAKDHFTVLIGPLADGKTPDQYWKSPESKKEAHRMTMPLAK